MDCQTPSTPQLRLPREVKAKAPRAYSEATATLFSSTTLIGSVKPAAPRLRPERPCVLTASLSASSAKKLCPKARGNALLGANGEALLASLEEKNSVQQS